MDMPGQHEIDQQNLKAYETSVEADKLLAAGRVEDGRRVMAEAAALSAEYSVRAELFGVSDKRRISVTNTVRRKLVPFLTDAGFALQFGTEWSEGSVFVRRVGDVEQSIILGRTKFGKRLGVNAARWRDPQKVEHFSWAVAGLRSNALAYSTQRELEAVCGRWRELMTEHLWPWFASQ